MRCIHSGFCIQCALFGVHSQCIVCWSFYNILLHSRSCAFCVRLIPLHSCSCCVVCILVELHAAAFNHRVACGCISIRLHFTTCAFCVHFRCIWCLHIRHRPWSLECILDQHNTDTFWYIQGGLHWQAVAYRRIRSHSVKCCILAPVAVACLCAASQLRAFACIRVHHDAFKSFAFSAHSRGACTLMHAHALECALIRRNVLGQHPRDALQLCVLIRRALHLLCEGLGQCCRMYDNGIFCIMQRYKNANRCNIMQVAPGMHQNAQVS